MLYRGIYGSDLLFIWLCWKIKLHIGKTVTCFLKQWLLQSSGSWQLSLVWKHLAAQMLNKQPLITFTVGRLLKFKLILSSSENKLSLEWAQRYNGRDSFSLITFIHLRIHKADTFSHRSGISNRCFVSSEKGLKWHETVSDHTWVNRIVSSIKISESPDNQTDVRELKSNSCISWVFVFVSWWHPIRLQTYRIYNRQAALLVSPWICQMCAREWYILGHLADNTSKCASQE